MASLILTNGTERKTFTLAGPLATVDGKPMPAEQANDLWKHLQAAGWYQEGCKPNPMYSYSAVPVRMMDHWTGD